ncbi:hypothetical protein [Actinoallomurus sp. NPDC050550]|uniref:hypothetical protein n=1 Tax=Actinoallomurus sp. NPDC050550 TaxID=3154937 RepID=UPI0033F4C204
MRTQLRRLTMLGAAAAIGVTAFGAVPAEAAAKPALTLHCKSSKGDEGWVYIYTTSNPLHNKITGFKYKIKLGKGGRKSKNDVTVGDGGVAPTKTTRTGDRAIGDNKPHGFGRGYSRGNGGIGVIFIFNHAGKDPRCHQQKSF